MEQYTGAERPPLDVVIPHYGGTDLTWRCLMHLWQFGIQGQRILVVDDCSQDGGRELGKWLAMTGRARYHRHEKNVGCTNAWNTALDLTRRNPAPWICFLNNDAAVMPGVLEALLEIAHAGSRIVSAENLKDPGPVLDPVPFLSPIPRPFRMAVDTRAACFIVERGLIDSLGGFDGRCSQAFGDNDFFLRARLEHGVEPKVLLDAKVYHGLSVAAKREGAEKSIARYMHDQEAFRAKWGDRPVPNWMPLWHTEEMMLPLVRKAWKLGEQ